MATTKDIADKLVHLCREGRFIEAINDLYATDITSHEPKGAQSEQLEGKEAVRNKTVQWLELVEEFHSWIITDPIVAGSHFACKMSMDISMKGMGRTVMDEICVYEVADSKIVSERFFYDSEN